jgi:hypothetical protein
MSFQWIIDNAEDIQINKRGVVATTIARDQTVRSLSRGGVIWRFTITPSSGLRYNDPSVRSYIETIDNLDRLTAFYANFSHFSLFAYQGTVAPTTMTVTQGSNLATVSGGSGTKLKSGDIVQLTGQPRVYSVYGDVTATNAVLNRPVLEASGTYSLTVGSACSFKLICIQIPDYKITPGNIIQWTGPFVFVESLL